MYPPQTSHVDLSVHDSVLHLFDMLFAVDSLKWRKVHDGDFPARYEHASFTHGSDLFVFGGAETTGPLNDIWKYKYCMYTSMFVRCAYTFIPISVSS